jgi:hypothetical protein
MAATETYGARSITRRGYSGDRACKKAIIDTMGRIRTYDLPIFEREN